MFSYRARFIHIRFSLATVVGNAVVNNVTMCDEPTVQENHQEERTTLKCMVDGAAPLLSFCLVLPWCTALCVWHSYLLRIIYVN